MLKVVLAAGSHRRERGGGEAVLRLAESLKHSRMEGVRSACACRGL
jgi:hypothetical protein